MKLDELLARAGFKGNGSIVPALEVRALRMDSRTIQKGDLYIGRLEFARDALANGACAAIQSNGKTSDEALLISIRTKSLMPVTAMAWHIAAAFYGVSQNALTLWGVTGTNGKTTVATILQELLVHQAKRCALLSTVEYRLGSTIIPATHTTPAPTELAKMCAAMQEENITDCALELSSHALEQERIASSQIDVALFTNLTRDHLDYHGSMECYGAAKQKLFEGLAKDALAIVNADDDFSNSLLEASTCKRIFTYALEKPATLTAENITSTIEGSHFDILYQGTVAPVYLPLIGRHNISNALAAVLALIEMGYERESVCASLSKLRGPEGRNQRVARYNGADILVDYAHTPDALEHLLKSLRAVTKNNLSIVFGCGGDRDKGKRPLMGAAASRHADRIYVTSDNPRTEDPHLILAEIATGIPVEKKKTMNIERRVALYTAIDSLSPGDVLVVAGKGHEKYQRIGSENKAFYDPTVVLEIVAELTEKSV